VLVSCDAFGDAEMRCLCASPRDSVMCGGVAASQRLERVGKFSGFSWNVWRSCFAVVACGWLTMWGLRSVLLVLSVQIPEEIYSCACFCGVAGFKLVCTSS